MLKALGFGVLGYGGGKPGLLGDACMDTADDIHPAFPIIRSIPYIP